MLRYDAIRRLRPNADFELVQDGSNNNQPYLARYSDPGGLAPPAIAEVLAAAAAIDAELATAAAGAAQLRQQVRQLAAGAVGTRFDLLTAQQVRALVAIVLWRLGALGADGTVQPLDSWAERRQ